MVVTSFMVASIANGGESLVAVSALIGLFTCVSPQMDVEISFLSENFPATRVLTAKFLKILLRTVVFGYVVIQPL